MRRRHGISARIALAVPALLVVLLTGHHSALAAGRPVRSGPHEYGHAIAGPWLQKAAQHGNARAQAELGYAYQIGAGVPQDYKLSVHWYRRAALQGNATAQYLLGMMYNRGLGVAVDKTRAEKWLILATANAKSRQRDDFRRIRDAVAWSMDPRDVARAQALASEIAPRQRR